MLMRRGTTSALALLGCGMSPSMVLVIALRCHSSPHLRGRINFYDLNAAQRKPSSSLTPGDILHSPAELTGLQNAGLVRLARNVCFDLCDTAWVIIRRYYCISDLAAEDEEKPVNLLTIPSSIIDICQGVRW
jgi:hypothetical protein